MARKVSSSSNNRRSYRSRGMCRRCASFGRVAANRTQASVDTLLIIIMISKRVFKYRKIGDMAMLQKYADEHDLDASAMREWLANAIIGVGFAPAMLDHEKKGNSIHVFNLLYRYQFVYG